MPERMNSDSGTRLARACESRVSPSNEVVGVAMQACSGRRSRACLPRCSAPETPADAEALEQTDEAPRFLVQLHEMWLPHGRDAIDLVDHDLGVHVDPDLLDPLRTRKLQALDQRLVLRHVVGCGADGL